MRSEILSRFLIEKFLNFLSTSRSKNRDFSSHPNPYCCSWMILFATKYSYFPQDAFTSNPSLIPGGYARVKAGSSRKARQIYAKVGQSDLVSVSQNVAMDQIMRDNLKVQTSSPVTIEMAHGLPHAHQFTVAPFKEDVEVIQPDGDLDQYLMTEYLKPYFSPGEGSDSAAISLNQVFTPGNTAAKVSFKVIGIEPKHDVETDPTGAKAKKMNGAIVSPEHLDKLFIADPVQVIYIYSF